MSIEHIRWIFAGGIILIMIVLAVMTQKELRRLAELDASAKKLEPGTDNKEVDETFAATLAKDPDA